MPGSHWADIYVEDLRRYFPELDETPIYIRQASEFQNLKPLSGSLAYTSNTLDVRMKPELETRGMWRGRGLAIVIENSDSFFFMTQAERFGIVLHETSHWWDSADSTSRKPCEEWTDWDREAFVDDGLDCVEKRFKIKIDYEAVTRLHHGASFVRCGIHGWRRCLGAVTPHDLYLVSPSYGSPSLDDCLHALSVELEDLRSLPICDVLKTEPPRAYVDLWPSVAESLLIKTDVVEQAEELQEAV